MGKKLKNERYNLGNMVNSIVIALYGTDGSYTYGRHSIMHRVDESLCCTLETKVTSCVNYTQIKIGGELGWPVR